MSVPSALVALLFAILAPLDAASQDLSSLSGDVSSSTGAAIVRARVMVLKPDLSDTLAVLFTDAQGHYEGAFVANVGIEEDRAQSTESYRIEALYPNPIESRQGGVSVRYAAPAEIVTTPRIEIFDVLGRRVDASQTLATGLYFVRLAFGGIEFTQPKSLVVGSSRRIEFLLQRSSDRDTRYRPQEPSSPSNTGKTAASAELAAIVRVDKDGFVTDEVSTDLDPATPAQVDFQLTAAALPTASFVIGGQLDAGAPVLFDASASTGANQELLTYVWAFADAIMGTGEKIAHVYTTGGTFDATLTVTGAFGARTSVTQQVVIAAAPAPVDTNGKLLGRIRDIDGFALPDVSVRIAGSAQAGTSDAAGKVRMENVDVGVPLTVQLSKAGHASQVVTLGVTADTSRTLYFEASLRPRDEAIAIADAENGFMRRARDGVMVNIPVDALVRMDGSPALGTVNLAMTPIDVGDTTQVRAFPGRFEGLEPDGNSTPIVSFGTAEFAFEQDGEPLQLAPGKTAKIEIPIYTSDAAVGDTIAAWSMNETTGSWVQEGRGVVRESAASPSGLALAVEVGHFTWWNCDARPEERNDVSGLCFKYECFNGICNKVKVFCWVEGAQKGSLDKREDLPPPVFTVREYWPTGGRTFAVPGNRETTIRGTTIAGDVLLSGDTTWAPTGGGTSSIELILDTVDTATELTLPINLVGTLDTDNDSDFYTFSGTAGQVVGFEVQPIGGVIGGTIAIHGPDAALLQDRGTDGIARLMRLPADGDYAIFIAGQVPSPRSYALRVYLPSSPIAVNSNHTVSLPNGDFRLYPFQTTIGKTLNAAVYSPGLSTLTPPRASLLMVNAELTSGVSNVRTSETGDRVSVSESNFLLVDAVATTDEVSFGLSESDPSQVVALSFDASGAVDRDDDLPYHGSRRHYSFDAAVGDGVELSFHPRGENTSLDEARFTIKDPGGNTMSFSPSSGKPGVSLSAHALRAHATGTYLLIVDDRQFSSRGNFLMRIRKVTPSSDITVDDDLACAGATTTSLTASLLAIQENGTVTVCNGLYEAPSRPILATNGVTISGESEAGVVISYYDEFRSPGTVMEVTGLGVAVRDLTIEADPQPFKYDFGIRTVNTIAGTTATFENLTIRPRQVNGGMGAGIDGQFTDVTIRNLTYTHGVGGVQSLNVSASNSIIVENSVLDYPASIRSSVLRSANISIDGLQVSDWTLEVGSANVVVIENSSFSGPVIATNIADLTVRDNDFIAESQSVTYGLRVNRTDAALVETNSFNRSAEIEVADSQTAVVSRNEFISEETRVLLTLSPATNSTSGSIVVQNNLVSGGRGQLVRVYFAEELGNVSFVNNTVVNEQFGNTSPTVETVLATAKSLTYTGPFPLSFVNNIFVGDGTTVFNLTAGTTIDADYNIYHNYVNIFNNGSSSTGGNDLSSNPLFANDNFELLSGSPALDSGATPAQYPAVPGVDFKGVTRPQGSGYDRGAHEGFVSGTLGAREQN